MQTTTTNQPTQEAIDTAIRNAAKMTEQGYAVKQSQSVPEIWFSVKPGGKAWYMVDTRTGACNCPYFTQEGICKHRVQIDEERALLEAEQAYEDYRDMIAARD
jgi:hypothetical protein